MDEGSEFGDWTVEHRGFNSEEATFRVQGSAAELKVWGVGFRVWETCCTRGGIKKAEYV